MKKLFFLSNLSIIVFLLSMVSCEFVEEISDDNKALKKEEEINNESNIFSLLGEVKIIDAGSAIEPGQITRIDLQEWAVENEYEFSSITLVEIEGKSVVSEYYIESKDFMTYCVPMEPKRRYAIYPHLKNTYLKETYQFLCKMRDFEIPEKVTNQLCELIYCEPNAMPLNELIERLPELTSVAEGLDKEKFLIGGLSGFIENSDICKNCLEKGIRVNNKILPCGSYIPFKGCEEKQVIKIIYERDADNNSYGENNKINSQIYLWEENSGNTTNLSNNAFNDIQPNVSDNGKWVVYASDRPSHNGKFGIYLMKTDGSQQQHIPGIFGGNPVFNSLNGDIAEILYTSSFIEELNVGKTAFYGEIFKLKVDLSNLSVLENTQMTKNAHYTDDTNNLGNIFPAGISNQQLIHMSFAKEDFFIPDDTYFLNATSGQTQKRSDDISISDYGRYDFSFGIAMHHSTGKFIWAHRGDKPGESGMSSLKIETVDANGDFTNLYLRDLNNFNFKLFAGFDFNTEGNKILTGGSNFSLASISPDDFNVYVIEGDLSSSRLLFGEKGVHEKWPNFLE